jgi:hypothetical protein
MDVSMYSDPTQGRTGARRVYSPSSPSVLKKSMTFLKTSVLD